MVSRGDCDHDFNLWRSWAGNIFSETLRGKPHAGDFGVMRRWRRNDAEIAYLGAVSSKCDVVGIAELQDVRHGPMSLIGSWAMPSSSRCAAASSNSALLADPECEVVQAGAILVEAVGGHRAQSDQRVAEVVDDAAEQER